MRFADADGQSQLVRGFITKEIGIGVNLSEVAYSVFHLNAIPFLFNTAKNISLKVLLEDAILIFLGKSLKKLRFT